MHFYILLLTTLVVGCNAKNDIEDDSTLTTPELIAKYKYPIENHYLETSDGYILNLHRIPNYGKKEATRKELPVYLQHGIECSSADWVTPSPKKGLPYLLADRGYDVWLGNNRGNRYSRNHTTLDPTSDAKNFWNFSWHEIGMIDVPEMIDYILSVTNKTSLYHIGHSQGTTTYYVMCSERPEYNSKVEAHISLAPIGYMNHAVSPVIRFAALFQKLLQVLIKLFRSYELLPQGNLLNLYLKNNCKPGNLQFICSDFLFMIFGFGKDQLNTTLLPVVLNHFPAGSSSKQAIHYMQEMNSGKFRQYDYGLINNKIKYNSTTPPNYQLENISSKVYLFWSKNDWLSNEKDVKRLAKRLPNSEEILINNPKWTHLDYLWGIDVVPIVYDIVFEKLEQH